MSANAKMRSAGSFLLLIVLSLSLLSLGCLENKKQTESQANNQTGDIVDVIVGQQKNQSIGAKSNKSFQNQTDDLGTQPKNKSLEYSYEPNANLGIYFIDVGDPETNGEAILIKKGDMDILVDAGPEKNAGKVIDFLQSRSVDDIEILVSTSADQTRYGGLNLINEKYNIEYLAWSGNSHNDQKYTGIINKISAKAKDVKIMEQGYVAYLNGMKIDVLNPSSTKKFTDAYNDAIVLKVSDRNFSILLNSGIKTGAQGLLINTQNPKLKTPIMQAPQYGVGEGTANIGTFLLAVSPKDIIITGSNVDSSANGGSRQPFKILMEQFKIKWYETYKNGTIKVASDGQSYSVQAVGS